MDFSFPYQSSSSQCLGNDMVYYSVDIFYIQIYIFLIM
jgi:hypothetical protein